MTVTKEQLERSFNVFSDLFTYKEMKEKILTNNFRVEQLQQIENGLVRNGYISETNLRNLKDFINKILIETTRESWYTSDCRIMVNILFEPDKLIYGLNNFLVYIFCENKENGIFYEITYKDGQCSNTETIRFTNEDAQTRYEELEYRVIKLQRDIFGINKEGKQILANITNYFISEETMKRLNNLNTNEYETNSIMKNIGNTKNTLYFKAIFSEDNKFKYVTNPLTNETMKVGADFPSRVFGSFDNEEHLIGFIKQMASLHQIEITDNDHQLIHDLNYFENKEDCYKLNEIFNTYEEFPF